MCYLVSGVLVAVAFFAFVYEPLLRLQGFVVAPQTNISTLAIRRSSDLGSTDLLMRNISQSPVRIVGIHPDCPCIMATNLPLTIAPGASEALHLTVTGGCRNPALGPTVFHTLSLFLDTESTEVSVGLRLLCMSD
jgi:hypothetical protein